MPRLPLALPVQDPLTITMNGFNTLRRRFNMQKFLIGICILLAASAARAESNLFEQHPFKLVYKAQNNYISAGTATLSLIKEESGWLLRLATSPNSIARMAGVGKIEEKTLLSAAAPPFKALSYSYKDKKRNSNSFSALVSDNGAEIVITKSDQTITVPTSDPLVSDRLSATLAVANELHVNPDFDKLTFAVLHRNGVRGLVYKNLGTQLIELDSNTVEAYLVESGRPGSSRKTRTWFAALDETVKSQRPLPVKIEQYKNNDLILRLLLTDFDLK